jgi:hypothetical protein
MNGYDDGKIIERLRAEVASLTAEIERLRARESEVAGRLDRLNVEVVQMIDKLKMIDKLEALFRSERPTPPVPCVDHPVLDIIAAHFRQVGPVRHWRLHSVNRESECVEFTGMDGQRFEIIVRPIARDEDEEST